jgi:hypothetical protein
MRREFVAGKPCEEILIGSEAFPSIRIVRPSNQDTAYHHVFMISHDILNIDPSIEWKLEPQITPYL